LELGDARADRPVGTEAAGDATEWLANEMRKELRKSEVLEEPLLDAKEAARLLKVPQSTLYELVRSRGLPHVRVGQRGVRFKRSDLGAWVAEHTHATAVRY
jgi:excisionase family DNA binding protein